MGVRVALDDMGAGFTSLRYMSAVKIHGLKIDNSFIGGMLHNPRDYTVVKLLTDLGHGLGLGVTAEGVENAEQLAALAELGCPPHRVITSAVPARLRRQDRGSRQGRVERGSVGGQGLVRVMGGSLGWW